MVYDIIPITKWYKEFYKYRNGIPNYTSIGMVYQIKILTGWYTELYK